MFAKINNNQIEKFPYSLKEMRDEFNNVSFPEDVTDEILAPFGVVIVQTSSVPQYTSKTQFLSTNQPSLIDGKWTITYSVVDKSNEQLLSEERMQAASVRTIRAKKLTETDWTQLTDAPVNSALWATYRQALRDVPTQEGFPWEVTWPTQPE